MDVGESLNPAIDIGQIEGAFVQGYGLFTLEEVYRSPNGFLFSRGPGTYKLPSLGDIPKEFNVALLRGAPNPRAVYSSKVIYQCFHHISVPLNINYLIVFFTVHNRRWVSPHFSLQHLCSLLLKML